MDISQRLLGSTQEIKPDSSKRFPPGTEWDVQPSGAPVLEDDEAVQRFIVSYLGQVVAEFVVRGQSRGAFASARASEVARVKSEFMRKRADAQKAQAIVGR